ncbi:alcohol-forming fatty acyl-CoA reductase-like isoform X2 [Camellia sinensis]|uniref:alcohol-forming fatty acyl-CoA reductase-like isoform X2 n=1 Tax=Camellia sinensis TaxID=4442 RepID=UPI0010369168|nr:alcohol-forming fatty acyl-CoA reductase-like isoform X2 [Camellia sinensis]
MELGSVVHFLENRTILVTGATGFLAKIFVEKILRVQPNVKKLYLLLRASDAHSASQRLHNEVISKDLFRVLREKLGANLNSLISEKVTPVAGDITCENLGVKDSNLVEEMWKEVDIVVNLAATTNFEERYDVALLLNTLGAKLVLDFAKKCTNIKMLLHISTAYVSGEREGLIVENSYYMGETLNGAHGLDIEMEIKVVGERLRELREEEATDGEIKMAMKKLGIQRTIDSMIVGYGKGNMTCFLADPNSIIDVIPGDMVVNAMMVAMVAHANQAFAASDEMMIYHVGSSVANPFILICLKDYGQRYFTEHPWIGKDGKPVIVGNFTLLTSMDSFHRYMTLRYLLPLKGLELVNIASCQYFQGIYLKLRRKINHVMRMIEIYRPYLFFKGIYDDINTEKLRMVAGESGVETDVFYFDPKGINWEDYIMNTHIPGLVRYVFK